MLDLSLSMPMRDNFLPAKKVAMALHSLISTQFPRDYLGLVGFSETARILKAEQLPEVSWDFVYGTNMQHGFTLARQLLARQSGTKQIIMITDGEPTAHVTPSGDVFFNYPPVTETVEATLREVLRCTRDGIRINTFMLDATSYLTAFVERLTEINRGRAFFTTPENARRLRARRLHRAQAPAGPHPPRRVALLDGLVRSEDSAHSTVSRCGWRRRASGPTLDLTIRSLRTGAEAVRTLRRAARESPDRSAPRSALART